jgi:hypothetical protein
MNETAIDFMTSSSNIIVISTMPDSSLHHQTQFTKEKEYEYIHYPECPLHQHIDIIQQQVTPTMIIVLIAIITVVVVIIIVVIVQSICISSDLMISDGPCGKSIGCHPSMIAPTPTLSKITFCNALSVANFNRYFISILTSLRAESTLNALREVSKSEEVVRRQQTENAEQQF